MTISTSSHVAIVTGAGSGFGAGIARKFASSKVAVVVADIAEENGKKVAAEIVAGGGRAVFVKTDVTSPESWAALVKITTSTFGGLNFVINNAGGSYTSKPVLETTVNDFNKCINLNLLSIFNSVHATIPALREAAAAGQPAVMVNVASTGGVKGRPGLTWYSASKAGAISVTQSMAHEFGPEGIRMNCICPVLGNTPLKSAFIGEASEEQYLKTIPLGRFAEPSDIGDAAVFLCSEAASFLTGVVLPVDGGRLA